MPKAKAKAKSKKATQKEAKSATRCAAISKTTKKRCKRLAVGRSKYCTAHKK